MPIVIHNPLGPARRFAAMLNEGMSYRQIARQEKMSPASVRRRVSILRLCPELLEMLERGELRFMAASLAARHEQAEDQVRVAKLWSPVKHRILLNERFPEGLAIAPTVDRNGDGTTPSPATQSGNPVTIDDIRTLKQRAIAHGQKRFALALSRIEVLLSLEDR